MSVQRSRPLVLLVDDSPTQARRAAQALEAAGFRVQLANNGREALEKARQWRPNVIVSDILMPVMDGFALCRELRRDAVVGDTPLVLHTLTYVDTKDEEFALALGATRFVLKPADPADLVDEVREALSTGHVRDRAAPTVDNEAFLRGYSERLAAKLEDKVTELEATNAWLADQHQETTAARDRLALLLSVSQLAASSLDLNVVLGRVVEGIVKALGVTYCRICLLDPAAERLVFQAAYPIRALHWEPAINRHLDLSRAPVHRAVLAARTPRLLSILAGADVPGRRGDRRDASRRGAQLGPESGDRRADRACPGDGRAGHGRHPERPPPSRPGGGRARGARPQRGA
jgi:CheY-like chemotaxis protein